jgi:vitamin B12 transporter
VIRLWLARRCRILWLCLLLSGQLGATERPADQAAEQAGDEAEVLQPITVQGERIANLQPASSYPALVSALRFDPQLDVQARGLPEGQADISVRGGLFENTGFRLGAVTIFDPQTGHYAVEVPIAPVMLTPPEVLTDVDHGLGAFNASVATVRYGFKRVNNGGGFDLGFGNDGLRYGEVRAGRVVQSEGGRRVGAMFSAAGSNGDGTLADGDHDFKRFSGQVQVHGSDGETNVLVGYHDKFFGWPGAYTGFASLPETDHTKLGLIVVDHRQQAANGWWELGAAYRWLKDDYDFDRRTVESGAPGSFEHETLSFSLGLIGETHATGLDWAFSGQLLADRLVRSTDLTHGHFNSRSYLSLSLAPGRNWAIGGGRVLSARAGLRADLSNRDEDALMPLFSLGLEQAVGRGVARVGLDFSRVSQLPGYTALNSAPRGLFGGNADLGREYADNLTLSASWEAVDWRLRGALFGRRDDDLVDWTYLQGAPFLRQANAVDIDVRGGELMLVRYGEVLDLIVAYGWIDKEADYGGTAVEASYYALNYARHRATLALLLRPLHWLDIRLDSEYRRQQDNPLRNGRDEAFIAALSISSQLPFMEQTRLTLVIDNATDSDFEEFPGTPAVGRQISLGLGVDW